MSCLLMPWLLRISRHGIICVGQRWHNDVSKLISSTWVRPNLRYDSNCECIFCNLTNNWAESILIRVSIPEQLEHLHSDVTPAASWLSHIWSPVKRRQNQSYEFKEFAKLSNFEFGNKHYTRHAFWSCLIRCANMKWIQRVLLKIQSWHDSVHRQTDGRTGVQTDKVKPVYPFQLRWGGGIIITYMGAM